MEIIFSGRDKEFIKREDLALAYRKLFLSGDEGKIVLNDLSRRARICTASFSNNAHELYYIEGMRDMFCYIASYLEESSKEEIQIKDYNPFQH